MRHLAAPMCTGARLLLGAIFLTSAVPLQAAPCTGGITDNILIQCRTLQQAKNLLPCGIADLANCHLRAEADDCSFDLGSLVDSNYILVEWLSLPNANKTLPPTNQCTSLAHSVDPCGGWEPLIDCPAPLISEEECDPDAIFCLDGPEAPATAGDSAGWNQTCHAYALMPRGWDEWTAARGFFTVGRTFPIEGLAWQGTGEGGIYGAEQALADDLLGPALLGIVSGRSPLWGGGKNGLVQTDRKALRKAGLCANPQGALLASPYWSTPNGGVANFPLLARCDGTGASGLGPYTGRDLQTGGAMDTTGWQASGALASDVLKRLEQIERRGRYELVCVTAELAEERRALRQAKVPRSQR